MTLHMFMLSEVCARHSFFHPGTVACSKSTSNTIALPCLEARPGSPPAEPPPLPLRRRAKALPPRRTPVPMGVLGVSERRLQDLMAVDRSRMILMSSRSCGAAGHSFGMVSVHLISCRMPHSKLPSRLTISCT